MSIEQRIQTLETELTTIPNSLIQTDIKRRARILEELSRLRRQQYQDSQTVNSDSEG